jgi:putative transposase
VIRPQGMVKLVPKPAYRSNRNVVYSAKYHLVWCPKYRRRVLVAAVETRLVEVIREVCSEDSSEILGVEVMPDHVHLLVEVDPSFGVSRLVRLVKGRSSRVLRQEFAHLRRLPTLWINSWFPSTVGGAPLAVVKRYVENQKVA